MAVCKYLPHWIIGIMNIHAPILVTQKMRLPGWGSEGQESSRNSLQTYLQLRFAIKVQKLVAMWVGVEGGSKVSCSDSINFYLCPKCNTKITAKATKDKTV